MQLTQKKRQRSDLMTAAAVAALLAVMAALLYTGHLTRQVTNMLIPTAVYIVMAVSLNLVVGLLGELSLGHAGFMSVGLFQSSTAFSSSLSVGVCSSSHAAAHRCRPAFLQRSRPSAARMSHRSARAGAASLTSRGKATSSRRAASSSQTENMGVLLR